MFTPTSDGYERGIVAEGCSLRHFSLGVLDCVLDSGSLQVHNYSYYEGRPLQLDLWSVGSANQPRPAIVFFHPGKLVGKLSLPTNNR